MILDSLSVALDNKVLLQSNRHINVRNCQERKWESNWKTFMSLCLFPVHSASWMLCGSYQKDATKLEKLPRHLTWFWPWCALWTAPTWESFPTLFTSLNCRIHCHGVLPSSARVKELQLAQLCWWHLSSEQSVGWQTLTEPLGTALETLSEFGPNYLGFWDAREQDM